VGLPRDGSLIIQLSAVTTQLSNPQRRCGHGCNIAVLYFGQHYPRAPSGQARPPPLQRKPQNSPSLTSRQISPNEVKPADMDVLSGCGFCGLRIRIAGQLYLRQVCTVQHMMTWARICVLESQRPPRRLDFPSGRRRNSLVDHA